MTYEELLTRWKELLAAGVVQYNWETGEQCQIKGYAKRKYLASYLAGDWQHRYYGVDYSYSELHACLEFFRSLGKRYGLLNEFRENGLI